MTGIAVPTSFASMEDQLHGMAAQAAGLSDFGKDDYLAGLRALLAAFDGDLRLTDLGRQLAVGSVVGTLTARLHAQRGWRDRPDCAAIPIRRPLVITGIPRTGTTALHKLLSMDPQFQGLEHWLAETPMVRPGRETWPSHPAYQASVASLERFFTIMPDMRKAHDMVAGEVEECLEVLRQSFVSNRFGAGMHVPSYDAWFLRQDERASYRRYAEVLRLIGADEPERQWLLKNPGHVAQIECLLSVFPDACVVHTHRDPVKAIASLCSTLHMARRMFEGDAARAEVIGPRECAYWSRAVERTARIRAARPGQFYDVDQRQFHADPLGTVRGIYEFFGLRLSEAAALSMQRWTAESPTTKHGEHRYDLASYGVSEGEIREQFAAYRRDHSLD
ncbi:MAG TPA: sulfotransferase [Steroidobacteraceae bacterium]|nr:sulfotransferase [Steroidobacteraceae bacterium]